MKAIVLFFVLISFLYTTPIISVKASQTLESNLQSKTKETKSPPETLVEVGNPLIHLKRKGKKRVFSVTPTFGRGVDFRLDGDRSFEITSVTLGLVEKSSSELKLVLVGTSHSWAHEPYRINQAAGLGIGGPRKMRFSLDVEEKIKNDKKVDVVFTPSKTLILPPGVWRLALISSEPVEWLFGSILKSKEGSGSHLLTSQGSGKPHTWMTGLGSAHIDQIGSLVYSIHGHWRGAAKASSINSPVDTQQWKTPALFSGVYPHLAMFNTTKHGECGVGAVVPWNGDLWTVTYSAYHHLGSPDKLFRIDSKLRIHSHPDSVGGTPANRMIHKESKQLLIGSHLIDSKGNVRTILPKHMPGRVTGTARHLTDPKNKVYYASMEAGIYEVDIHSLKVTELHGDTRVRNLESFARGTHGKGLYSGQGRLIYANNGGKGYGDVRELNQDFERSGSLNEWDGKKWKQVHGAGFLDISGPGGIRGNEDPKKDPLWSIGWDYRSVILKVLDQGKWFTYRLPKGSHTMDGPHGYNTEWPRIGEIGSRRERLIYTHGMFWRFPSTFSSRQAMGIRPRSTYLKMVSDSAKWKGRIVFACNDLSNEIQAIKLNRRKLRGKLVPAISHSNLWFVKPGQVDDFGIPIGRGSVWMHDSVKANHYSDPFQCAGWDRRLLHLSHESTQAVRFTIELDLRGNGEWSQWKTVTVPAKGYLPISFDKAPSAEWVRLKSDADALGVIATFYLSDEDSRPTQASELFQGIAEASDTEMNGGLVRIKYTDEAPLSLATADGYYEMGTDMQLRKADDPIAEKALRKIATVSDSSSLGLTLDSASLLYIDDEDGRRYRMPRGDVAFDSQGPLGHERVDREVVRERNLFNAHGTFYELPYRNAGGFAFIRPITTHNRRIKDYCSWRGLFVISGLNKAAKNNKNVIHSKDSKVGVWLGVVDDLWHMGKAVGVGGPWRETKVKAGVPSDQYLMTGYDKKTLTLSHEGSESITIKVEVDVTGHEDWKLYKHFEVPTEQMMTHVFPQDFNAYWVRTIASKDTIATAQFKYE